VAIGKPRGKAGMRPVYVYDPRAGRKVYVGSRQLLRDAKQLERDKTTEFAQADPTAGITIAAYAAEWLELHHGPGTRRPAPSTLKVNTGNLKPFLTGFGSRTLDSVTRRDALRWSKLHPHNAVVVCAMFNDAIDDEECKANPFAGRKQEGSRERKHIHPLTEDEVNRLADIAYRQWGSDGYGRVARAWVLFAAWVGCRPGETFAVQGRDLDFARGEVTIRRVKKRGRVYPTDVVVLSSAVIDAVREMQTVPATGPLFTTVTGLPFSKGNLRHHWDPVRSAFRETVTPERWAQLLDDTAEEGTRRRAKNLDFYVLRHFCASVLADRGCTAKEISAQLGNSEQVCQDVYIHLYRDRSNDRVRDALNRGEVSDLEAARRRRWAENG
jgi:integrase